MSQQSTKDEDEIPLPERPPSPPLHTTFGVRGIHPPNFSAFKPRDYRMPSHQAMNHVAWSCDGKKLAAVGIDKSTRVWNPEKSMEMRSATTFVGGHTDDVDYVSWNPTHPELFCTSGSKDRRIVFWDARQSRYIQQCPLKASPVETCYAPDGRSLLYATAGNQLFFMTFGKTGDDTKEEWHMSDREAQIGSTAIFNHVGDAIVVAHQTEHTVRVMDIPSMKVIESPAAHVGGCVALALDPRGRYLASGGHDSIVNMFDLNDWICARTITVCENSISALSFSYDGEYLAIANAGPYIDICATETGIPLHRVPASGPSPTVAWHPSKYLVAYCGQAKVREGSPSNAFVSTFGLLE
ncbi:WD40-repeat-containing domain protein [Gymnopilus junonius]|uniref:WD40-repeat-containing domain protein n=1 Tax=Gymnopilus junonius TaxID=109634 RepID=A0A9P5P289_GYMJU|nr:WD40-repeat-containing domain protein [Gymnopilus junonius]